MHTPRTAADHARRTCSGAPSYYADCLDHLPADGLPTPTWPKVNMAAAGWPKYRPTPIELMCQDLRRTPVGHVT